MTKYGTTAVGWDYWGNMSSVASHTYSFDDSERLTKFNHATGTANDTVYGYLPGSWKRYKRTQDTTTEYYIFDGDNVLASYAADGTLTARYLTPGLDENLSMTSGGSTYYYMQDGLGSVRNVVDSSQVTQNTYDYYAFGNELAATQGVTSPYQFTGREREAGGVLSQHYYRNRYYLPALGIFAARDAFWADPHQGWGYVGNEPTSYGDPYGWQSYGEMGDPLGQGTVDAAGRAHDMPEGGLTLGDIAAQATGDLDYGYIDCMGDCLKANDPLGRLGNAIGKAAVGNGALNAILGDTVRSGMGTPRHATSWQHGVGEFLDREVLNPHGVRRLRELSQRVLRRAPTVKARLASGTGRVLNGGGRLAGRAAVATTVAQGAVDAARLLYCAQVCARCPDAFRP